MPKAWREYGVQPWRVETFKFSTDPELVAKVTDVVGLYLEPPENAIVLCVDEKSQIQALDRTMPVLPMQPGLVERRSHDYLRHGTTTLFAALEIATGQVTAALKPRHRNTEFLAFLKQVERTYRGVVDEITGQPVELHLVMDNYAAHKHANVTAWLTRNPRFVIHFTPTSGSWMNMVEIWFGIIERQAIHRGSYGSVKELNAKIRTYIDGWNDRCHPFVWTKTADDILTKAKPDEDFKSGATRTPTWPLTCVFGGAEGTRTPDPLHAMQMRYQLRHSPGRPPAGPAGNSRNPSQRARRLRNRVRAGHPPPSRCTT